MERTDDTVIKIEDRQRLDARRSLLHSGLPIHGGYFARSFSPSNCCLLCLDPTPKLFMGDSWSYIWTALTGWIPGDRSYFYGAWYTGSRFGLTVLLRF